MFNSFMCYNILSNKYEITPSWQQQYYNESGKDPTTTIVYK